MGTDNKKKLSSAIKALREFEGKATHDEKTVRTLKLAREVLNNYVVDILIHRDKSNYWGLVHQALTDFHPDRNYNAAEKVCRDVLNVSATLRIVERKHTRKTQNAVFDATVFLTYVRDSL